MQSRKKNRTGRWDCPKERKNFQKGAILGRASPNDKQGEAREGSALCQWWKAISVGFSTRQEMWKWSPHERSLDAKRRSIKVGAGVEGAPAKRGTEERQENPSTRPLELPGHDSIMLTPNCRSCISQLRRCQELYSCHSL